LIAQNYRSSFGEIDLIMMENRHLVFVEVRYRLNDLFGGAALSVDHRKQAKIRRTAESFLQSNESMNYTGCRFDVVAVSGNPPDLHIEWIVDAF
jgi:putative endonuclease